VEHTACIGSQPDTACIGSHWNTACPARPILLTAEYGACIIHSGYYHSKQMTLNPVQEKKIKSKGNTLTLKMRGRIYVGFYYTTLS
jgi:hypothetical protein